MLLVIISITDECSCVIPYILAPSLGLEVVFGERYRLFLFRQGRVDGEKCVFEAVMIFLMLVDVQPPPVARPLSPSSPSQRSTSGFPSVFPKAPLIVFFVSRRPVGVSCDTTLTEKHWVMAALKHTKRQAFVCSPCCFLGSCFVTQLLGICQVIFPGCPTGS